MIGQVFFAFVLVGTSYAAFLDLKSGEVPDVVSIVVAAGGLLFHAYLSLVQGSISPLVAAIITGTGLFLIGWIAYLMGVWGGADAFVLGAVGFALPRLPPGITPGYTAPWPFPVSLVMTILLVGAGYSLLYALYKGMREPAVFAAFREDVWTQRRWFLFLVGAYLLVAGVGGYMAMLQHGIPADAVLVQATPFFFLLVSFLILSRYLHAVEQYAMQKTIPVEDLSPGDVLAESLDLETPGRVQEDPVEDITGRIARVARTVLPFTPTVSERVATRIVGVTEDQIVEIQEKHDEVAVKTGVRFIAAFPAAIIVLAVIGDPFMYLILSTL